MLRFDKVSRHGSRLSAGRQTDQDINRNTVAINVRCQIATVALKIMFHTAPGRRLQETGVIAVVAQVLHGQLCVRVHSQAGYDDHACRASRVRHIHLLWRRESPALGVPAGADSHLGYHGYRSER